MDKKQDSDHFDIPVLRLQDPPAWRLSALIGAVGAVSLFAVHTLFLLYAIDARIAEIQNSPENWKRIDMSVWCSRVMIANPGFVCPDPYDQTRPTGYPDNMPPDPAVGR